MKTKSQQKVINHNKPTITQEEMNAVLEALSNLELTIGTKVREFENTFSKYIGIRAISLSSGTSALHLALIALGISKNDEVILPSYTCISVAFPVLYQQAKPVLVDVNDDYNISIEDIKLKITDKTKAIIVPHMFGYPADLKEIKELCREKSIYLVEDCAQSIGALYHSKKVGRFGDVSIFSFYATKMMTTIQGGMVCTENSEWIEMIKDLRYHDQCRSSEDNDLRLKYSYMMSDVGAAIGIVQLRKLENFINRRREIANLYQSILNNNYIQHPVTNIEKNHVYSRYIIKSPYNPDKIIKELQKKGIECARMYIPPLHKRAILKPFNIGVKFPKTDEIVSSTISIPIFPTLTDEEVLYIGRTLNNIMNEIIVKSV